MIIKNNRLRELDFLRGIAIILVLFRHQLFFSFLKTMGWIGVDLFFVISGFLVSGLLFREFEKYGNINPKLFLIRRGFKIYPIFYLTYIAYIIAIVIEHKLKWEKVLFDIFFIQNYALGWGYAYPASWSLAVEEHFYFGLTLLFWVIFNKKIISSEDFNKSQFSVFERLIILALLFVFVLRIISNIEFPVQEVRNITMTHLRIDSLLAGVLISYWYNCKRERLISFYLNHQKYLLLLCFILISFTPFIELVSSFFIKTIGFSMLYIAFGILLIHFLVDSQINYKLNRLFSKVMVTFISKIGFCSYSIYVIHTLVIYLVRFLKLQNHYLAFVFVFFISVGSGFLITYNIEKYFLSYRDKYFPSRVI